MMIPATICCINTNKPCAEAGSRSAGMLRVGAMTRVIANANPTLMRAGTSLLPKIGELAMSARMRASGKRRAASQAES